MRFSSGSQWQQDWKKYVKDVGMVCAKALKRNRMSPRYRYVLAQID